MRQITKVTEQLVDRMIDRAQEAVDQKNLEHPDKRIRIWRRKAS